MNRIKCILYVHAHGLFQAMSIRAYVWPSISGKGSLMILDSCMISLAKSTCSPENIKKPLAISIIILIKNSKISLRGNMHEHPYSSMVADT